MEKNDLNILIVEDDFSFALDVEMMLDQLGYTQFTFVDNSEDALDILFSGGINLVLMDIDIKGNLSGTEVGKKTRHLDIPTIFLTSFDDESHYKAAHDSNIAGYLIKPTNKFTLESTIKMAFKNAGTPSADIIETNDVGKSKGEALFIKKNKEYHKLFISDIMYITAEGNYTVIHRENDKFMSNINFSKMESLLPDSSFIKTHRSYVINIDFFSSINVEESTVSMRNGAELPISRSHKQNLLERMRVG